MGNCWFCYKDAADANYHPSCAKKFFGTEEVCENIFMKFKIKNDEVFNFINKSFLDKEMKKGYKELWNKKQEIFR